MKFSTFSYLLIVTIVLSIGGCDSITTSFTDGFSDNPNDPTNAPANRIFVASQIGTMTFLESHSARKAGMFSQYFSGEDRQYLAIHNYNTTGADNDSGWFLAYVRGLTNLRLARESYAQREVVPVNQIAATKVLEAMLMGNVTALFGDVPFTEAVNSDETNTPSYDAQSDVYASINTLLDEAIATLSNNTDVAISDDVTTLDGDTESWLKVAYTLKARYLMHTGNYNDALAAAQNGIDAVDGSGDMLMPHGPQQGLNQNLYYNFTVVQRAGYLQANNSFADQALGNGNNAKTDESARQDYYFATASTGRVLNNDGFAAAEESFPHATYLENQLIIAEIQARQGGASDQGAIDALNNSRDYLDAKYDTDNYDDLTLLDFQAGGAYADMSVLDHTYYWTYLGLIGQIEGFNFLRRIDYAIDGLTPVTGNSFPERFVYPQTERNTNPNVPSPAPGIFDATSVN